MSNISGLASDYSHVNCVLNFPQNKLSIMWRMSNIMACTPCDIVFHQGEIPHIFLPMLTLALNMNTVLIMQKTLGRPLMLWKRDYLTETMGNFANWYLCSIKVENLHVFGGGLANAWPLKKSVRKGSLFSTILYTIVSHPLLIWTNQQNVSYISLRNSDTVFWSIRCLIWRRKKKDILTSFKTQNGLWDGTRDCISKRLPLF